MITVFLWRYLQLIVTSNATGHGREITSIDGLHYLGDDIMYLLFIIEFWSLSPPREEVGMLMTRHSDDLNDFIIVIRWWLYQPTWTQVMTRGSMRSPPKVTPHPPSHPKLTNVRYQHYILAWSKTCIYLLSFYLSVLQETDCLCSCVCIFLILLIAYSKNFLFETYFHSSYNCRPADIFVKDPLMSLYNNTFLSQKFILKTTSSKFNDQLSRMTSFRHLPSINLVNQHVMCHILFQGTFFVYERNSEVIFCFS